MHCETVQARDPLVQLAIDGDPEALNTLFGGYRRRLYHTALRLLGNGPDAEDALQDGLLAAFRNLNQFEGRSQFSTWLTRVVTNAALMLLRSQHARRAHLVASIDEEGPEQEDLTLARTVADRSPNPEEAYARQERLDILKNKLKTLPPTLQSALRLRHVEGLGTRKTAEALGLAEGTLKSQLHRARVKVSKQVRDTLHPRARALDRLTSDKTRVH